jgi:hypothetical protein
MKELACLVHAGFDANYVEKQTRVWRHAMILSLTDIGVFSKDA